MRQGKVATFSRCVLFLTVVSSQFSMQRALGDGGDFLWQRQVNQHSRINGSAAQAEGIFMAGGVQHGKFLDFFVQARSTQTGKLLWKDQFDNAGSYDEALAIIAEDGRVFAVGTSTNNELNSDFLVRAYNAQTGALLWQDRFDNGGGELAFAVAVQGDRVFTVGDGTGKGIVRVYSAIDGTLIWQDQSGAGGFSIRAIATQEDIVFTAGVGATDSGNFQLIIRAYDGEDGTSLWTDKVAIPTPFNLPPLALAIDKGRVFASASIFPLCLCRTPGFLLRALDVQTGSFLWELDKTQSGNFLTGIAAQNDRLVLAGSGGDMHSPVETYDAASGVLLWADSFDDATALALTTQANQVLVTGSRTDSITHTSDAVTKAYNSSSGEVLWTDTFGQSNRNEAAETITAQSDRVFIAGLSSPLNGKFSNVFVRAYSAQ
jgi:outer membrane protein assembly factor BamB